MSDTEKPTDPQAPPPAGAPEPTIEEKQSHVRRMRERAPRPLPEAGKVPSVQHEVQYGGKQPIDAFDAEMEAQLNEALQGFDESTLLAREDRGTAKSAPEGPKKGK